MPLVDSLPTDEVAAWLRQREHLWEGIEGDDFESYLIDGERFSPFNVDGINRCLAPNGLLYSAGIGGKGAWHFFLAELEGKEEYEGGVVWLSGRELARDITAPPAMSLGTTIFLRRESFRRMVWEKVQESDWTRNDTPMKRAMKCYGFERDQASALIEMSEFQLSLLLRHERGEHMAGVVLGRYWEARLEEVLATPLEQHMRMVRDNLADCMVTLPEILSTGRAPDFHFYFANISPGRKELFPLLLEAYDQWLQGQDVSFFEEAIRKGQVHWLEVCQALLKKPFEAELATVDFVKRLVVRSVL